MLGTSASMITLSAVVRCSYGGGPGCKEVPLGGDRVLQCDSQRNSKAPMSSYFT